MSCINGKRSRTEILERNERGEKKCAKCLYWLPEDEFLVEARLSDGLRSQCKACDRFGRYGLTRRDVERKLAEQNDECPICSKQFGSYKDFVVDHDHKCCEWYGGRKRCGKCTRGLVCIRCNVNVLAILEDRELVARATAYLESY